MVRLDSEEHEILEAFESGVLSRTEHAERDIERHREIADATFRQDARINIHLSSRDLRALQVRALTEGIPFEMLVASVLHKFVDGQLVEKPSV